MLPGEARQITVGDESLVDQPLDALPRRRGGRVGDDGAALDHREPRAERGDVVDDVGREEDDAADGELGEEPVEPLPLLGIEAGRRLVDDDDPRIAGDRLR
jgi:hypothetical protein